MLFYSRLKSNMYKFIMKILTAAVNNTDFIELQYHTLKKFFRGEYEFIVFNDAKAFADFTNDGDLTIKSKIQSLCERLNIRCINIPNDHHQNNKNAGIRCADSMMYILEYQKQNPDEYLVLDSDMFLIDYFDVNKYSQYDCAVVLQSRNEFKTNYFWNGIYYFNMKKMKNQELLNWYYPIDCDVGGMMQEWLKRQMNNTPIPNTDDIRWKPIQYSSENMYFIKHLWSCSWDNSELPDNMKGCEILDQFFTNDPRNVNGKYYCEIYDNAFLHYRAGGNWNKEGLAFHNEIIQKLKSAVFCLILTK